MPPGDPGGGAGRRLVVYRDRGTNPRDNLGREDEIFGLVESRSLPEVVRFWVNEECLVRGRAKSPKYGWYDEGLASGLGIPVIERSTGGGVVYQDLGNLNWGFFLRTSGAFLSPKTAFGVASGYLVGALRGLGVPAQFAPPNRIDVSGRKVSGLAARSTIHTLLVHGTLLLNSNLERLNLLCLPPDGCPPVSNLSEWLGGIDADRVVEAAVRTLRASGFCVTMVNDSSIAPEQKHPGSTSTPY